MLTLKHVEPTFHENIIEIMEVGYQPRQPGGAPATVFATVLVQGSIIQSTATRDYTTGRVYVMNDKGRTIQQYYLDEDNAGIQPAAAPVDTLWPQGEITALRQLRKPADYLVLAQQLGRPLAEVVQKAHACGIYDENLEPENATA